MREGIVKQPLPFPRVAPRNFAAALSGGWELVRSAHISSCSPGMAAAAFRGVPALGDTEGTHLSTEMEQTPPQMFWGYIGVGGF